MSSAGHGLQQQVFEDLRTYGPPGVKQLVLSLYRDRTFRPVFTLRLAQRAAGGPWRRLANLAHRWACSRAAVDLPTSATVGPGLRLNHGWGIVVAWDAVLGRDVVLMHGATIGGRGAEGRSPRIGDRVFIGPNASVLGDISIGNGATISAGCVVVEDVPPDTLVTIDKKVLTQRRYVRPTSS